MSTSDAIKKYYDREWQRFQTDVKVFAQTYPEQAGALNLESPFGRDPNIDHLLQGCTYLSAQIHKRIDEETNTLPSQLAMQLWPQMVENVPSMSIASFQLKSLMAQSQVIPAKTALLSQPVGEDKTVCRFETLSDLPIYPFQIAGITVNHALSSITLAFDNPFDRPVNVSSINVLPLFLADDYARASELYYYLRHCHRTIIKAGEIQRENVLRVSFPVDLPDQCLKNPYESGLLAHQILFDYFTFHQKYLFVILDGFSALTSMESTQFEITLFFDQPMDEDFSLTTQSFIMNACVIANRFAMECEPIKYDHSQYRYPVHQDRRDGDATQVLSIDAVQGIDSTSGRVTHYLPLHRCEDPHAPSYTMSREIRDDEKEQIYISCFMSQPTSEVISVTASVCHGFYPKRFIAKRGLSLAKSNLANICRGTNVLVPTKMLKPPSQVVSQSFIRYFTMNLSSLLEVNVLKRLLHTLNWTTDPQHKRRIEGILDVSAVLKSQVSKGAFFHITEIQVQVHDSHFVSRTDIYLFGEILHAFFSAQAAMSQMISMQMKTYPNEEVFEWKPIIGQKQVV
ncbi:MAG: type VI secretion system baseplate subunit TssF [Gammaproteobacteria bacterium]